MFNVSVDNHIVGEISKFINSILVYETRFEIISIFYLIDFSCYI